MYPRPRIPKHQECTTSTISVILRQAWKIRYTLRAIEISLPNPLGQDFGLHAQLPTPLDRILRDPSPVEPAPADFKARHLSFGILEEPSLVRVTVFARVGVGVVALAVGRCTTGTGRREDGSGGIGKAEIAFPAGAGVDVVEVGGAVGVGLGPFAAEGGTVAEDVR